MNILKLIKKVKNIDIKNENDVFLLSYLLLKSNNPKYEEDMTWIVVKDDNYKIKFVKNMFFNQLYYCGNNISGNPIYDIEISVFDEKMHKIDYESYKRSKLPDYMKTTYDLNEEEAEKIFYDVWNKLIEHIKPRWSIKRIHYNLLYWLAYRSVMKQIAG